MNTKVGETLDSISNYYGRKITAIGFSSDINDDNKLFIGAALDTSTHNIYLQEGQDISITRRDTITTDTLFYSNSRKYVPGPAHLAPLGVPQIIYQPNIYHENGYQSFYDAGIGKLYSVGLSSFVDYIDKEFIVGIDIQVENEGTELIIKGLENYFYKDNPLFCDSDMFPSNELYPIKANYKYIIFKYKVWQRINSGTYGNVITTDTDTGYFYHQAIPIDKFGKTNIRIKYERG